MADEAEQSADESAGVAIPDDDAIDGELVEAAIVRLISLAWSSPLPPPDVLERYNRLVPGSAAQLFEMAKAEQTFRHSSTAVINETTRRGQTFAFILVVLMIAVGAILTLADYPEVGGVIFGTTILGVAGVFVVGRLTSE